MSESLLQAAATPGQLITVCDERVLLEAAAADAPANAPRKFSAVAYNGGAMKLPGYHEPVVIDLAGVKVPNQVSPVLRQHDPERPIGHTTTVEVSAQKIKCSGVLSGVGPHMEQVQASASNGYPWQTSVGMQIDRAEHVDRGQTVKVNGRNQSGPCTVIRAANWRELSFVTLGADSGTSAQIAAKYSEDSIMTFSEWLKAKGVDETTTPESTLTLLKASYKAEQTPTPTPTPAKLPVSGSVDEVIQAQRAENVRTKGIADLVAKAAKANPSKLEDIQAIGQQAVEAAWDLDKTEMKLFVASTPTAAPLACLSGNSGNVTPLVLEAALAQASGLQSIEKAYDERVLEAADKHFAGGIGLQELILICAQHAGYRGALSSRNIRDAMRVAFRPELRAEGPSTYNIDGILSNVANKYLREQFLFTEQEYNKLAAKRAVKDFKTITTYSLTGDLTYKPIAPGGEIKSGKFGEISYTNKADTYGIMLAVDRRDLKNDDLGALTSIYKRLGRGGGLIVNKVFWTTLLGAQAAGFFAVGNNNYEAGAGTAFGADGLVEGDTVWQALTDPDGLPMATAAKYLVVPKALRIAAERLMHSQQVFADNDKGGSNPWAGAFEVVSSQYMSNSNFTGYSTKAWYLFADPNDVPAIELCFLDGQEMPKVESVQADADQLGLVIRAYHDFGCALQEKRGAVKLKGEA